MVKLCFHWIHDRLGLHLRRVISPLAATTTTTLSFTPYDLHVVQFTRLPLNPSVSMVDVQRPLSMPPTLVSHQSTFDYTLPPLQPTRPMHNLERDSTIASARSGTHHWGGWHQTRAVTRPGKAPSPRQMAEGNGNPLLAPPGEVLQYKSVPVTKQTARQAQTSLGTIASVQYISKAPPTQDTQRASSRPRSPSFRRDGAGSMQQGRGGAAENNLIASYLQIPSSINNSKGSLADFAAQVWQIASRHIGPC